MQNRFLSKQFCFKTDTSRDHKIPNPTSMETSDIQRDGVMPQRLALLCNYAATACLIMVSEKLIRLESNL